MNKLSQLARKFQLKLAQEAVPFDNSLESAEQPAGGIGNSPPAASVPEQLLDIDPTIAGYLKNKQYWLIPWDNFKDIVGKLTEDCFDAKKQGNQAEYTRLYGLIVDLNQHREDRVNKLFNAVGRVLTNVNEVQRVQQALKAKGQDLGQFGPAKNGIDGLWGQISFIALCNFQKANSLPETGTLTPGTVSALGLK